LLVKCLEKCLKENNWGSIPNPTIVGMMTQFPKLIPIRVYGGVLCVIHGYIVQFSGEFHGVKFPKGVLIELYASMEALLRRIDEISSSTYVRIWGKILKLTKFPYIR
jgi:hypothetical protein